MELSCFLSFNAAHCGSLLASSSSHRRHPLAVAGTLRISNVAVTEAQHPPPKTPPYIHQYLIDSCGFSPDRATRASKHIAHIKHSSNPDSVIRFLKDTGLDDAQIRDVIAKRPMLLYSKVEPTLKAKLRALLHLGFSEAELPQLIHLCPETLTLRDMKPKIEFWRAFFPTNEGLFKAIRRDQFLLSNSIEKILRSISLLRSCSLSDSQIARMILRAPRLITSKLDSIEELVQRAKELGVPPGSGMFFYALCAVNCISQTKINAKIRLLESLGCSEAVIRSRPQTLPNMLMISEKKIKDNMDFLIKKAGCDPSYVIYRPALLQYSLERRLIPRHLVLQILRSKELAGGDSDLFNAMSITEGNFLDKFVVPHKETVPELHEAYLAACSANVAIQSTVYEKGDEHENCSLSEEARR